MNDLIRFNIHGILNLGAAFLAVSLGSLVYFRNPKGILNRGFAVISMPIFMWLSGFGMMSLAETAEQSGFWFRFSYFFGVPFITPCFDWFADLWNDKQSQKKFVHLPFSLAFLLMIPVVVWGPTLFDIRDFSWGRYTSLNESWLSKVYLGIIVLFFTFYGFRSALRMIEGWKNAPTPLERQQYRNFFIGLLIAYAGGTDFLVTAGVSHYPLGYAFLCVFLMMVAYSIVRHRFLDVKLVIRKLTVLALVYSVLIGVSILLSPTILEFLTTRLHLTPDKALMVGAFCLSGFLSMGPFLYAYLIKRGYWLRGHHTMGLVHELKSPLSTIESISDLICHDLERGRFNEEKAKNYFNMIQRNTLRLQHFVRDLLIIAKESTDISVEKKPLDFCDVIKSETQFYMEQASQNNLALALDHPDRPVIVEFDEEKIRHVLSNLLSNAIKYSKTGTITLSLQDLSDEVVIRVRDQGIGIHSKDLKKVFEKFYQSDRGNKGTGIGLSIAKLWVNAHGGKIWAESDGEGKGTTVTFTIPK